jgi:hypothetical protein
LKVHTLCGKAGGVNAFTTVADLGCIILVIAGAKRLCRYPESLLPVVSEKTHCGHAVGAAPGTVKHVLETSSLRVVRTPVRAPNCNAHVERFVRSIQEECLNRVIPLGERHFRPTLAEFPGSESSLKTNTGHIAMRFANHSRANPFFP